LKCGSTEIGRPEKIRLAALSAVSTIDLFGIPSLPLSNDERSAKHVNANPACHRSQMVSGALALPCQRLLPRERDNDWRAKRKSNPENRVQNSPQQRNRCPATIRNSLRDN
jgi:hypothetical protein